MFEEERYQLTRVSTWAKGQAMKGGITGAAAGLLSFAAGAVTPWMYGVLGVLGVGIGTYITKSLEDLEHERNEQRVLEVYRKEIAARVRKSPDDLTMDDLKRAAYGDPERGITGNTTLKEVLDTNDKKSRVDMRVWMAAAVITTATVFMLFVPVSAPFFGLFAAKAGAGLLAAVPSVAIKALVGLGLFHAVQPALQHVAYRATGIEDRNVYEYVRAIGRLRGQGREIRTEQVLGTFIEANPQLAQDVKNQYGRSYDEMLQHPERADHQLNLNRLVEQYGAQFNVEALTNDINRGLIRPTELSFLAYGQTSGVARLDPPRPMGERVKEAMGVAKQQAVQLAEKGKHTFESAKVHALHAMDNAKEGCAKLGKKLGMHKPVVQGATAGDTLAAKEAAIELGVKQSLGAHTDRVLSGRETGAALSPSVG